MDREVRIAFIAKTAGFARDLHSLAVRAKEVQSKLSAMFEPITKLGKNIGRTIIGFSSTLGAALGLSSKSAIEFEQSMRNVNSILGASPAEFRKLEDQILHLAGTVPKSANDLAQASYQIVSSGFTNAASLNLILAASAKAATAGLTSTSVAAQGITTVLQSYNMKADKAAHVSDVLFQTVNVGMVNFEQLTQQMGDFLGLTSSVGIKLEESMGLYASLTLATGQYAQSATAMTGIARAFLKPSEAMTNALAIVAPNGIKAAIATKGLTKVLYELKAGVKGDSAALAQMFQDTEGLRGVLALTRKPLQDVQSDLEKFLDPMRLNGATAKVFKEQMKAVGNQLTQLHTAIGAAAISMGTALMPFGFVIKGLKDTVNVFNALPTPVKEAIGLLAGLAAVLGTVGGFLIVFRVKQLLVQKAFAFLGFETKGAIRTALQFGQAFVSKGKVLTNTTGILGKTSTAFSRLGSAGIPSATRAIASFGAKIPVIGKNVSTLTTSVGTGLGTAMARLTTRAGTMGGGFSKIGHIINNTSKAIVGTQRAAIALARMLPMMLTGFMVFTIALPMIDQLRDKIHHVTRDVEDYTASLAAAAKQTTLPSVLDPAKMAQDIKNLRSGTEWYNTAGEAIYNYVRKSNAQRQTHSAEDLDKWAKALTALQALDPVAAAAEFDMITKAMLQAGVKQSEIDKTFGTYIKAVKTAALASGALPEKLGEIEQAEADLTSHTMKLTSAQEALKAGFTSWGDLGSLLGKATSARTSLTSATTKDTSETKRNQEAHDEWVAGAEGRNITLEQSAISVTRATMAQATAQKTLDDLIAGTDHLARLKSAEDSYTAALRSNKDAHQRVIDITKQLDSLRHPTPRTIAEAEDTYTRALNDEADGLVALDVAQQRVQAAKEEGDPELEKKMNRELVNAQIDQREKVNAVADALLNLNTVRGGGDPEVVAGLTQDLADANDGETKSLEDVTQAEKDRNKVRDEDQSAAITAATLDLKSANLDLRSAIDGVTSAEKGMIEKKPELTNALTDTATKIDDAKASAKEFSQQLRDDLTDQNTWLTNLQKIARDGPPGMAAALTKLGIDGKAVVAEMATQTPEEMTRMFNLMVAKTITGSGEWAVAVSTGIGTGKDKVITITDEMVKNVGVQLGISVADAKLVLENYLKAQVLVLAPFKTMLDEVTANFTRMLGEPIKPGSTLDSMLNGPNAGIFFGNLKDMGPSLIAPKAQGGFERHVAQIASGGNMRLWNEPETGGEAYIPLAASKRSQSMAILGQVADHFGAKVLQFADGGMLVRPGGTSGNGQISVQMPIHIEARIAAGVDMDYAGRVIAEQVQAAVEMALNNLGRQIIAKSGRR